VAPVSDQGRRLEYKLADFDRHADLAVTFLVEFIEEYREPLIAQAKGRMVEGHFRYADRLMYEYSADELLAETSQEVADAVNYLARRLSIRPES
jgi:hypothetical protein